MAKENLSLGQDSIHNIFRLKPLSACIKMALASSVLIGTIPTSHAQPIVPGLPVPAQTWVKSGSATKQIVGNALNIRQNSNKAILHWDSFNVGAKNQVNFQQPNTTSIALNRIFQKDASKILGSINANGQVYLYNRNGFIFGKNSTVDTNTLVATALDVSDDVFNTGITKNFAKTGKAALGNDTTNPDPALSKILVEQGAKLKVSENGRMILAAPNVSNNGKLEADKNGQIMLIASKDKVYLAENVASSDNAVNKDFSGLLVEVGTGGTVENAKFGEVLAKQGNATLAGFAVNQSGRISATTSTKINGSIRLLAREGAGDQASGSQLLPAKTTRNDLLTGQITDTAKVTFGQGSLTQVVPDEKDNIAIDEQKQPLSSIQVSAHTVHLQAGSKINVPGGNVSITASRNPLDPKQPPPGDAGNIEEKSRIILDQGARIDVSGAKNITASVKRNVVDIPVQSYELRNSPLQKKGVLQGQTVRVDIRKKNAIVDTGGAEQRIERSIDERLGKGGTVDLVSAGDVIVNPAAKIDISGGSIYYQGGFINTSKLLTDYGAIIDISDADPNLHYRALLNTYQEVHQKWGVTNSWQNAGLFGKGNYEAGYLEGLDAGFLNLTTPKMAWNGTLVAGSANGVYQRTPENRAFGGAFSFNKEAYLKSNEIYSQQNIVLQNDAKGLVIAQADPFPSAAGAGSDLGKAADLVLSTDMINRSGIQEINLETTGKAIIASNAKLALKPGKARALNDSSGSSSNPTYNSRFALLAGQIEVNGNLYAPGGYLGLGSSYDAVGDKLPESNVTNRYSSFAGNLTVRPTAKLDVSGRWANDFAMGLTTVPTESIDINGGMIALASVGDINLEKSSRLNADGGAWLEQDSNLVAGKAGAINIKTVSSQVVTNPILTLNSQQSAFGLMEGGKLSLTVAKEKFTVGRNATYRGNTAEFSLGVTDGHFDLFGSKGFGAYNLANKNGDLVVAAGTSFKPIQQNLVLNSGYEHQGSAENINAFSNVAILPAYLRKPVDLFFTGQHVRMEKGSRILADNRATISLESGGSPSSGIFVDGLISAPAGTINLRSTSFENGSFYDSRQVIWLGRNGNLQAAGTSILSPTDALGLKTGEVLDGGKVRLETNLGKVILEQGSNIDVSGSQETLAIKSTDHGGRTEEKAIASNGGKISITATEGIVADGEMMSVAGSASTKGGTLAINLDKRIRPTEIPNPPSDKSIAINVNQNYQKQLGENVSYGADLDDPTLNLSNKAVISSEQIGRGGFDDLVLTAFNGEGLEAAINFNGNVKLATAGSILLNAPAITWNGLSNATQGRVNLSTAYFNAIGGTTNQAVSNSGGGIFSAKVQWADFSAIARWDGFKQININASRDIRTGNQTDAQTMDNQSELLTGANLNLTAGQIYPSTLAKFTFAIDSTANPEGKITLAQNGSNPASPLSAGGELTFDAPNIVQAGNLKAPFGKLNLTASRSLLLAGGSQTSVSGSGLLIPFGTLSAGKNWLYGSKAYSAPPEKKVVLSAPEINLAKGSKVDLSGGGDLYAYEFQPGIGGSSDYLGDIEPPKDGTPSSYQKGFAVMPSKGFSLAPHDPLQNMLGLYPNIGEQIYLNGSNKLASGFYTILPARYALLPGAFLITPQTGSQDQQLASVNSAGLPIVGGYRYYSGSGKREARWSRYMVENGADIRKHSQYQEVTANDFFTDLASKNETTVPILPKDGGQLVIKNAQTKLALDGDFKVTPAEGGLGAKLDIAAQRLNIVNKPNATSTDGALELLATSLSRLNVGSLFLGGERVNKGAGVTDLTVTSEEITFDHGTRLSVSDLIAAATQKISVKSGATLTADGKVNTGDKVFRIAGSEGSNITSDGALLRLSGDKQAKLIRVNAPGLAGDLQVGKGATISASQSILLDASHSSNLAGNVQMQGGSLNLSANKMNLGDVDNLDATDALNLSNADLARLNVDELVLTGRDSLNFYGNVGLQGGVSNLLINTGSLSGFEGSGQTANLKADNIFVQNTTGSNSTEAGTGEGNLVFTANSYRQGNGAVNVNGFKSVAINAEKDFTVAGNGKLDIHSDFQLNAAYLTAIAGKILSIDASGYRASIGSSAAGLKLPDSTEFGGGFKLTADAIRFNTAALLPSGNLELHSLTGDLAVDAKSRIDLSGRKVLFGDTYDYSSGGEFIAKADQGKIVLAKGSKLNVSSGGEDAKGGKLNFFAPRKTVELLGGLQADGGSAKLDVAHFNTSSNLDNLLTTLNSAGISDYLSIRARQADLNISGGMLVNAEHIKLSTDIGNINLDGRLNSNHDGQGGTIELYAGDKITLKSGSLLSAQGTGTDATGGKVLLSATADANNDRDSGIEIKQGATIDVSGSKNQGGKVILRALRTDTDNNSIDDSVAIKPIVGTIQGAAQFYADGVKKYRNSDIGSDGAISSADITKLKDDIDRYMTIGTMQKIGKLSGNNIKLRLRPGIEINYSGDLSLEDEWNLVDWRYSSSPTEQGLPGVLALNATGSITFRNSLTDGFATEIQTKQVPGQDALSNPVMVKQSFSLDKLRTDDAWSYAITAGYDAVAADISEVDLTAPHNITLTSKAAVSGIDPFNPDLTILNTYVRTGSGDINLSASGNIEFGGGTVLDGSGNPIPDLTKSDPNTFANPPLTFKTAIYTAGKAQEGNRYGSFSDDYVQTSYGYDPARTFAVGEYPLAGGDLRIHAGGDIVGSSAAPVFQDIKSPWLVKQGNPGTSDGTIHDVPTAWGVDFAKFSGNIGVFGGGKADVSAGNDIKDLAVALPTTGKPVGDLAFDFTTQTFNDLNNKIQLNGGGELAVDANGNIAGGSFLVGQGKASLIAGGDIRGSYNIKDENNPAALSSLRTGSQLLLGNTKANLNANRDIVISAVSDPLVLPTNPNFPDQDTNFFSYGANSGITAKSLAGDLSLDNQTSILVDGNTFPKYANYYPATLNLTAFNGSDIFKSSDSGNGIALFPAVTGSLNILASDKITSFDDASPIINMSDADSGELPSIDFPSLSATPAPHAPKPVHLGGQIPVRLATQQGNIENVKFFLSKKAIISSGHDIIDASFSLQHANASGDVSIISASRDISFPVPVAAELVPNEKGLEVAGTGELLIKAGRNIDLGTSMGILSVGNGPTPVNTQDSNSIAGIDGNPNLSPLGANITVMAGLNGMQPDYLGLAKLDSDVLTYADNFSKYQQVITEFMRSRTGNTKMSTKSAFEQFKQLSPTDYATLKPQFTALASSNKYKDIISKIKAEIVRFVRENKANPALPEDKAIALFNTLKPEENARILPQLNALANQILFTELDETGSASAADPLAGNERGFKAIGTLYPGTDWKGDIGMAYSTIQTQKGGDINLLVPGGLINVGLPVTGVTKADNELGIIASGKGAINAFLDGNFNVNQSRVFALGGDNIMIWSSHGDIDAGRGAKSALAISDPVFSFDTNGNSVVDFPPPVAGSGIRTAAPAGLASSKAGNVGLYAPGGVVNAGEAGIGGNNVTISATAVLGANNIDVGGASTGVPVTSTVSLAASLTGASNVAANASKMAQASADMSKHGDESGKDGKKNQIGTISVELIGFGA